MGQEQAIPSIDWQLHRKTVQASSRRGRKHAPVNRVVRMDLYHSAIPSMEHKLHHCIDLLQNYTPGL